MINSKLKSKISTKAITAPLLASAVIIISLLTGCGKTDSEKENATALAPRTESINIGPAEITLTLTPGSVFLDRDITLTMRATAPKTTVVQFPPISDRLSGFIDAGHFDREPVISDNTRTIERVIHLTPTISDEYRIAPMAITCIDKRGNTPSESWGATPAITLPLNAITPNSVGAKIKGSLTPVWIRPSASTIAIWIIIVALIIASIPLLIKLSKRLQYQVRLMRMSPRERALEELRQLLNKNLIEKHLIKDFYVELTMVVRRYIERRHKIRAPEQTTEEFMQEISNNPKFKPEVIKKLRQFLQAADLVKFAAYTPDNANNTYAIETAKEYITTDDEDKKE